MNVLSPGQVDTPDSQRLDKETREMFEIPEPAGKDGSSLGNCDGRAVSCFRRSELREWGGVVCRRRFSAI